MTRLAWLLPLLLLVACAPAGDDDDNDDDDSISLDDDEQPVGACLCCYTADENIWGYCWSVGIESECDSGCALLYDADHLRGALFTPDAACLDIDANADCRAEFP